MVSAVLFDLFGTLVPSPPRDGYREVVDGIATVAGLPQDDFFDKWMSVNDGRLSGTFKSSEGEIAHVTSMFGVSLNDDQIRQCVRIRRNAMASWLTPKLGSIEALQELARRNFKLALVSDCVFDVPAVWAATPIAALLPVTVFSCEQGVRKPHPSMYLTALEQLGVQPANSLFVGDGGSNELAGAKNVGMRSLLLDDQPVDQTQVLRVDVHEWDGLSVRDITEVVKVATSLRDEVSERRVV